RNLRPARYTRTDDSGLPYQGPDRPADDRGRRGRRKARTRRNDHRGDGGQYRPRTRTRGDPQGLSAATRHPRQDEPGEGVSSARDGRRNRDDAIGRRQGASRVLPGYGATDRVGNAGRVLY